MKVSVLLITYNGIKYIEQQLLSILQNLGAEDELIVSDDGSTDGTMELVEQYRKRYSNIVLVKGPHSGIASNLSNAFQYSEGDFIFFSDQDDEWLPGKISKIKETFIEDSSIDVIMHDGFICDQNNEVVDSSNTIFYRRNPKHGVIKNLAKSAYYGCCMAFRRSFLERYMPMPSNLLAYDQFLGLCAEHNKSSCFLREQYIMHRYHGSNQSKKQTFYKRCKNRMIIIFQYFRFKEGKKT